MIFGSDYLSEVMSVKSDVSRTYRLLLQPNVNSIMSLKRELKTLWAHFETGRVQFLIFGCDHLSEIMPVKSDTSHGLRLASSTKLQLELPCFNRATKI